MTIIRPLLYAGLLLVGGGAACAGFIQPPRASTPTTPEGKATPASTPGATLAVLPTQPREVNATLEARRRTLVAGCRGIPGDEVGYYLDVLGARLRQLRITGGAITRQEQRILIELSDPMMFEAATAVLSSDARRVLGLIRPVLAEYDQTLITVHAHTGATARSTADQRLAEQRATVVALQFTAGGISARRLVAVGHGGGAASTSADAGARALIVLWLDPVRASSTCARTSG